MSKEKSRRIRQFTTAVSSVLGPDSVCGRVSDAELIAILPGADQAAAEEAAKQVVQRTIGRGGKGMRSHVFEMAPAALSEDDTSVDSFIERARSCKAAATEFLPKPEFPLVDQPPVEEQAAPETATDEVVRPKTASIEI